MRTPLRTILSVLAIMASAGIGPALAQSSRNPNALNDTNDRLANQSELRGMRQQQQFENNQNRMQIQRNELSRPLPTGPGVIQPRR